MYRRVRHKFWYVSIYIFIISVIGCASVMIGPGSVVRLGSGSVVTLGSGPVLLDKLLIDSSSLSFSSLLLSSKGYMSVSSTTSLFVLSLWGFTSVCLLPWREYSWSKYFTVSWNDTSWVTYFFQWSHNIYTLSCSPYILQRNIEGLMVRFVRCLGEHR